MKIIFIFLFALKLLAADSQEEQMRRQIEEVMKARDEILKSLMDDSSYQDLNSRMERLMKDFDTEDFFQNRNAVVGEYDWLDTKTHKILSLKIKQIKDQPLDIKINKGQIILKGDVESQSGNKDKKRISKVHFERVFSIPPGVDQNNPEFENKNGEFLIKFKKKMVSKETPAKKDLEPIAPSKDDQKI